MSAFENLPVVPMAPSPWNLKGQGYILAVRLPREVLDKESFIDKALAATRRGPMAYVMFVDYERSDAGPYHELLYIPGSLQFNGGRHLSISKIYVSTWNSVVNGHENWGIPKEHCDFTASYGSDGVDEIKLLQDGHVFADLKFSHHLFRIPFNGSWLPKKLLTIGQWFKGRQFRFAPQAKGHIKPARLLSWKFDSALFPDLAKGKVVACVKVTGFEMVFPVAEITTL
ncbi:MAG: acetoacetate decarboxylase family protein [Moraxellaceae bacterium]